MSNAPSSSDSAAPRAGELLADKYRVEEILGEGGMGVVVAARHLHLDERVAIKFLQPSVATNPTIVARFLREGRASIKIRSEHVVRVLDVATLPSGAPYMVMELLEGSDLAASLAARGPLPLPVAVDWVLQAMEAIAEAHALGLVHRDLKPANLFLAQRADGTPCIKVLDFGISKETQGGAPVSSMTRTNAVMGSPLYMSPEQMRSTRSVDARTDIWALGAILYELLIGTPPFHAETMPELLAIILQDPPPKIAARRADVPPAFDAIVERCLAKDPAARFADVGALAAALAPFGTLAAPTSAERIARVLKAPRVQGASPASPQSGPVSAMTTPGAPLLAGHSTGGTGTVQSDGPPGAVRSSTQASWSDTRSRQKPGRSSLLWALPVLAVAAIAAIAFFVHGRSSNERAAALPTERAASVEAPVAVATVTSDAPAPIATPASSAPAAPSASSAQATNAKAPAARSKASSPPAPTSDPKPAPPPSAGLFDERKY